MAMWQAEKLRSALRVHLPPDAPEDATAAFLDELMAHLAASWHLELTPSALGQGAVAVAPDQAPAPQGPQPATAGADEGHGAALGAAGAGGNAAASRSGDAEPAAAAMVAGGGVSEVAV